MEYILHSCVYGTAFRGMEPKFYSITILKTVLYGEVIWGVDKVHYNLCSKNYVWFDKNLIPRLSPF